MNFAVFEDLQKRMGDRLPSVVEKYMANSDGYLATIEAGIGAGDAKAIENAAHPMKSSSAMLGAEKVQSLALALEEMAEQSEGTIDEAAARALLDELKAAFEHARDIMTRKIAAS